MTGCGRQRDTAASGQTRHVPVLLSEMLAALLPKDGETYLDATFGAGGYSKAILKSAKCQILAIDRDPDVLGAGQQVLDTFPSQLTLFQGRFSQMEHIANSAKLADFDGIVLDIGVSSMQLDQPERGFSFMRDGPLDMRMGKDGESAADILMRLEEKDLADIFFKLGEERRSRAIAKAIVAQRKQHPLTRTSELAGLVEAILGRRPDDTKHPATRVFQALRLFVNRELTELVEGLHAAEKLLKPGGRLVVVTFHSLEDRIVKRFLTLKSGKAANPSRHMPADLSTQDNTADQACFQLINRRAVKAGDQEVSNNPRARSAQLRAAVRTTAQAYAVNKRNLGVPDV